MAWNEIFRSVVTKVLLRHGKVVVRVIVSGVSRMADGRWKIMS